MDLESETAEKNWIEMYTYPSSLAMIVDFLGTQR
jgi:hypothetical protein